MKLSISLISASFIAIMAQSQSFTEDTNVPFVGLQSADVEWADVDDDGDLDVVMGGANFNNDPILSLYLNDGNGGFSLSGQTAFSGHLDCELAFLDADGDGDQDLIAMGWNGMYNIELYVNDGNGSFTIVNNSGLSGMGFGDIQVGDIDGDGDVDVVTSGQISQYETYNRVYRNDGAGYFEEELGTGLPNLKQGEIELGDIDSDGDLDMVIIGRDFNNDGFSALYLNDGSGDWTLEPAGFPNVAQGDLDLVDVDSDSDLDLMFSGVDGATDATQLYENDGSGNFTISQSNFPLVYNSSHAFADIDGDNDLDMILTGTDGTQGLTELYLNDGMGNFTPVSNTPFDGHQSGEVTWADVDSDGDQDVLLVGVNQFNQKIAKLYLNDNSMGIVDQGSQYDVTVYPNPTQDHLFVPVGVTVVGMVDVVGGRVDFQLSSPICIRHLPAGLYSIRLEKDGRFLSRLFIKE